MFEHLEVLKTAEMLARHAEARQGQIARNVANADTPGYRAGDVTPFAEAYARAPLDMRAFRPGHLRAEETAWGRIDAPDTRNPNGNTVSLEEQMLKAAETRQDHDLALTVYTTAMSILRTSLGGRR